MSVLGNTFALAGTVMGRPVIMEMGECTDDGATISSLTANENGRVILEPAPRANGILAKSLDGVAVNTTSLNHPALGGTRNNCMQLGRTEFSEIAPTQPSGMGTLTGKRILQYSRRFVQLAP